MFHFLKKNLKRVLPEFLISCYHFLLAFFSALFFCFPSKKLKVIGVTGTKGKTTVVEFVAKILEEAGFKVALVCSNKFKIAKKEWQNKLKMTMPGRTFLARFLRKAKNAGCEYVVIEVTSEGIKQFRHKFIKFDVVCFTNLSPEHIESHRSFEKYKQAKGKLFHACKKIHILNLDSPHFDFFYQFKAEKKYLFSLKKKSFNLKENEILIFAEKLKDSPLTFKIKDTIFSLSLFGDFNIYNAVCAISICLSQKIPFAISKKALEKITKIPGRMEIVVKEPFLAIVDYAHTPDSLKKVYQNLKKLFPEKELICVFGACGGGRDKWKRPEMGKIAAQFCSKIILTDEDPYDEDPLEIINQIKKGILEKNFPVFFLYQILDREKAIEKGIELAKKNKILIVTGKGSEPWICVKGGKKIPWDDRKVVLKKIKRFF